MKKHQKSANIFKHLQNLLSVALCPGATRGFLGHRKSAKSEGVSTDFPKGAAFAEDFQPSTGSDNGRDVHCLPLLGYVHGKMGKWENGEMGNSNV